MALMITAATQPRAAASSGAAMRAKIDGGSAVVTRSTGGVSHKNLLGLGSRVPEHLSHVPRPVAVVKQKPAVSDSKSPLVTIGAADNVAVIALTARINRTQIRFTRPSSKMWLVIFNTDHITTNSRRKDLHPLEDYSLTRSTTSFHVFDTHT